MQIKMKKQIFNNFKINFFQKNLITFNIDLEWIDIVIISVIAIILVLFLLLLVAYAILLERKILGSVQKRRGPNLVGIFGLLQPIADAVKLIIKETIIPPKFSPELWLEVLAM